MHNFLFLLLHQIIFLYKSFHKFLSPSTGHIPQGVTKEDYVGEIIIVGLATITRGSMSLVLINEPINTLNYTLSCFLMDT